MTVGLGDFVPSTDGAKILCACFIYIGVATIGLLLGSLLAGSMDKANLNEAREAQIRDCPNCLRMERMKRRASNANFHSQTKAAEDGYEDIDQNRSYSPSDGSEYGNTEAVGLDLFEAAEGPLPTPLPVPEQRPARIHTRHMSIDVGGHLFGGSKPLLRRTGSGDGFAPPTIDESTPFLGTRSSTNFSSGIAPKALDMRSTDDSYSTSSTSTDSSSINPSKPMTRVKAAKYIFLTLKQALVNSMYIITAGSIGFYYIEGMSAVDAFYFTTVLLTSVGYGDIVPVTTEGKRTRKVVPHSHLRSS